MFRTIVLAFNESSESKRALTMAISLARSFNASLALATIMTNSPMISSYAIAVDAAYPNVLDKDRQTFYDSLNRNAAEEAQANGVELSFHLIDGRRVDLVLEVLRETKADLLVLGLHRQDLYISRLWSKIYELANESPCSVLGVR